MDTDDMLRERGTGPQNYSGREEHAVTTHHLGKFCRVKRVCCVL